MSKMHIYFDLDHTLVDDAGGTVRPGIRELLEELKDLGHTLSIWTASTEKRASEVLERLDLKSYFTHFVFRDDYDPNSEGFPKDIRYRDGDLLIDDTPSHIEYARSIGKRGILIPAYITENQDDLDSIMALRNAIYEL